MATAAKANKLSEWTHEPESEHGLNEKQQREPGNRTGEGERGHRSDANGADYGFDVGGTKLPTLSK